MMDFGIPQANQNTLAGLVGPNVQVPGMGAEMFNGIGVVPGVGRGGGQMPQLNPAMLGQLGQLLLAQRRTQPAPQAPVSPLGSLAVPSTNTQSPQMITQQILQRQLGGR